MGISGQVTSTCATNAIFHNKLAGASLLGLFLFVDVSTSMAESIPKDQMDPLVNTAVDVLMGNMFDDFVSTGISHYMFTLDLPGRSVSNSSLPKTSPKPVVSPLAPAKPSGLPARGRGI